MPKPSLSEQFDQIVTELLASPAAIAPNSGQQLADVAAIAAELRSLPRQDFKATLKAQLEGRTPMASKPVTAPDAQQTATAYLTVKDAARAIEFYKQAFGATEIMRMKGPGESIGHAQIRIGNTVIMLSDELPQYGGFSAETLGGSPVKIHLHVDDVDAVAARALAAGARVVHPVQDQFYGERSGQFRDPFGYVWMIATQKEQLTPEEVKRRFDSLHTSSPATSGEEPKWSLPVPYIRKGFHTVTPYLLVAGAAKLIDFFKTGFGAEEIFRMPSAGESIMHAELRLGDSMLELSDATAEFPARRVMHILQVDNVDASYRRALDAGGTSLMEPVEQAYGDREAGVADVVGNHWYLTERRATDHVTPDTRTITPGFSARNAAGFVDFMKQAFGAQEAYMHKSPKGEVIHGRIRIGDSILAVGEAHGDFPPMPFHLHMYVPDTDSVYARALAAGATSKRAPKDEPYGDRAATVEDAFGNLWSIATHIKDVQF
jgi:PhnB protein